MIAKRFVLAGAALAALCATTLNAQVPAPLPQSIPDERQMLLEMKARLDSLEHQNRDLKAALDKAAAYPVQTDAGAPDAKAVEKVVNDVLKKKDDDKKAKDAQEKATADAEGYRVGTDLKGAGFEWDPALAGWVFYTKNRDFTWHPEARIQMDATWWHQSPNTRAATQLGDFEDGADFRRVRIHFDGTMWEVFEYNFEFALENIQGNVLTDDEQYIGINKIPGIGTVRIGHMRVPHGFEGDMMSSSKAMQFLERSAMTDAIMENINFSPGIWAGNYFLDSRMTYQAMFYRTEVNDNSDADFGDGEYAATARITALPIYENEGRCLLHLGFSSTWQAPKKGGTELTGPTAVRLRARPEFARDFQGAFTQFTSSTNPGSGFLPGNDTRLIDTGAITCEDYLIQAGECVAIMGPFSVQAEAAVGTCVNAVVPSAGVPGARGVFVGDLNFWSGYVSLSYFLTGENRLYDQRLGREGSLYVRPRTPFWFVRDENGGISRGLGAWEVVGRYSYTNLNDGPVQGGVMQGLTFGLNWYLTTNTKLQFDYGLNQRWNRLPGGQIGAAAAQPGSVPGTVEGFAIRTQWMF
jgi:phosphate-selective porin OprO/OprP